MGRKSTSRVRTLRADLQHTSSGSSRWKRRRVTVRAAFSLFRILTMVPSFKPFTVALIQLGEITANKSKNLKHAHDMILRATANSKRPELIVLPVECFNSPYGHVHFPVYAEKIGFIDGKRYDVANTESESVKMLSRAAKLTETWLIGGTIPESDGDNLYNTCTVFNPQGDLVATYRKIHLFDIDIPGKITFKASNNNSSPGTTINSFDTEFARIGLGICYDVRFPELAMISARKGTRAVTPSSSNIFSGCHVLIYPGAFNTTTGPLHWEVLQRSRAVDNQVFFAMCSPARDLTANYHAWGHSMVVDPMASVLVEAAEGEEIVFADIDPSVMESARAGIPVTKQRRFDVYPDVSK
ncbi:CN hydrolase domain-containing protein [Mycena indigotica]|uniref:CN hydrolase domain-containing protein n=1 Tax=Mycena indigotica TaxID=2126181 RepID=A0A8H6SBF7_9AGAR|nr:CN hydrolase domain-containing protein [Mycena indigotica]KAF7295242.1 CN hydrolase domain-containing protein [Mycena indigotica]